jgi:HEAT repeat protein
VSAPVTVIGRIREPSSLDLHGRRAGLEVEHALRGPHAAGAELTIAWEELSEGAALRFRDGQRVLVVLEPAPDWSLWRERLPVDGLLVIAARGRAWLADPEPASAEGLARFLALSPAQRDSETGVQALARLVAAAQPELALAALDRLASEEGVSSASVSELLRTALLDPDRPLALRRGILALGVPALQPLRPAIDRLAEGGALELAAVEAKARLDGALPTATVLALLARPDPPARVLAVRRAGAALGLEELETLAERDPAPEVRRAAVVALAARVEPAALASAAEALFDPDQSVRAEAALRLGARGAEAVPLLLRLALERGAPDAGGPVVALGLAGPAGHEALVRIMATHEDEDVRSLAGAALGRPLPEP